MYRFYGGCGSLRERHRCCSRGILVIYDSRDINTGPSAQSQATRRFTGSVEHPDFRVAVYIWNHGDYCNMNHVLFSIPSQPTWLQDPT